MQTYWYVVHTSELVDKDTRAYIGTAELNPEAMWAAMGGKKPIVLNDLTRVSIGGETKKYSDDWEPHPNTIYLNPRHISSVVPLPDDWREFKASWNDSVLSKVEEFLKNGWPSQS